MKKYKIQNLLYWRFYATLILILFVSSCDNGFEEMNINPNAYNDPVLKNLFSQSIVFIAGVGDDRDWGNDMYANGIMQYFSSFKDHWTGMKYLYDPGYNDVFFNDGYRYHLKDIEQIISLTKDSPEDVNLYAMSRIMRVYSFHRVTDLYGDIPYSQANKGYLEGLYHPKYDKQADIYTDMLKELEESLLLFDTSKGTIGAADFLYNGNIAKWKRFANSLMLRLGMRLTKVDIAKAETYVKKAIAGGVMQSNDDLAKLEHTDNTGLNWNWDSYYQVNEELRASYQGYGDSKLSDVYINFLKDNNDPRLPFYATLWEGNVDPTKLPVTSDPAVQKGLPIGYNATTIKDAIPDWTSEMYLEYSELNLNTIANMAAPTVFLPFSEVEFLLAEAALRGWDAGNAETYYNNGVTAAMEMVTIYPGGFSIPLSSIDAYLTAHPFAAAGTFDEKMEQIHNQYWVAHMFVDGIESFANWRRTGYPVLTPINYPGNVTGGVIPRRLLYPESEKILNTENYNAAVAIQGPDLYTSRIWWDKQ
jgi:hypothetical protein